MENLVKKFEEIMAKVGADNGMTAWYEIIDSEVMDKVEEAINAELGAGTTETEAYEDWFNEMTAEL